jgi:hypothetical protein
MSDANLRSLQNGCQFRAHLHVIQIVDSLSHVSHKELQIMAHVIVTSGEAKFKVAVTVEVWFGNLGLRRLAGHAAD